MEKQDSMRFLNVADLVSVSAFDEETNQIFVTVTDTIGRYVVIVIHPGLIETIGVQAKDAMINKLTEEDGN
jgi:hypothetical protein